MCGKFFRQNSPLFCLQNHPRRGKLRMLAIALCIFRIASFLGASIYFIYHITEEELEFETIAQQQEHEARRSSQSELETEEKEVQSAIWSSVTSLIHAGVYAALLFGVIRRILIIVLGYLALSWVLPLLVIIKTVLLVDVDHYGNSIGWGLSFLLTMYELWVFTLFERELKVGEEVHLGAVPAEDLHQVRRRTDSSEAVQGRELQMYGGVCDEPSFRLAEKSLHKSSNVHAEVRVHR